MIEVDGSPAILNLLTDITERRKAERALLESEQQYRNVIEDQTEFICRFRPDGTHIFVNEAYCRYFNKKREEILWHRFLPEIPPEDQKSMKQFFESLTPENPVDTIEHRIIMYDGSIRWQRWSDRAIFSENGTIIEYQSVGRDVTEIKKAEEAINLANQKLQLLSEITRHDILNQLTALRTCLLMADDVEKDAEKRDLIQKEQQIAATIEAQIQFTKDYQTVGIKAPAWHNVRESLMRSVRSIPILNVKVEIERADFEILADPLFDKVFSNLIDNSLRHGGAKMDLIRFSCRVNEERLVCSYEDNGVGILPDDKPLVFNRGFGKHTGLGMFLTKEILAITGITITENGEFGNGARFEITVPKGAYRLVDV